MGSSAPIHVFAGVVHPERDAIFQEDAPPKSIIKDGRKEAILACTKCGKGGTDEQPVKKCAGCKLTYYCSQKCQRDHWQSHKPNCTSELGEGTHPLIKSVTGNPMMNHYIQLCIALEYSLHQLDGLPAAQRRAILRQPRSVHIDVGIEPTMIGDFMTLYTYPDSWDKDGMEGMLQFHHLSRPDQWEPPRKFSANDMVIWSHARADADEDGDHECAVAVVQFVNNFKQCITCPFVVDEEALGQARRNMPFTMGSAITGKSFDKPLSVATCFEYLNTHIRADRKNQLMLRAPMRPSDKELIRDAGRQKNEHAPRMLRLKMSREGVYVSHPSSALNTVAVRIEASGSQARRTQASNANADPLPESRQIEHQPQESTDVAQEPPATSTMNRAERRRQQQEQKKAAKKRR